MKTYQNYVFDLYGTLVDIRTDEEQKTLWEKMSLFFGYYGAAYTPEALQKAYLETVRISEEQKKEQMTKFRGEKAYAGKEERYAHEAYPEIPIEHVFQKLYTQKGVEPEEALIRHTGQMFRVLSTHHVRLYAGAAELLHKLHEAGKKVYLLSNAQRIFTEYELVFLKIHDCFDGILISSAYGVKKPDEAFFSLLFEKYRIKPEESLMIGNDLNTDILGAKRAGMDTFYIHSAISPEVKQKVDADYFMMHMNLKNLQKQILNS